ncbi:AAA family ATPase [Sphingomonas sp. 2R-10]|uniref:ExeA family protein n=1 Tax=Sphingomonas sp. 2R-10 TaxID=3045148 RepID=UPI000F776EE1|nr:AAA family ATPase [Sphingomonas sp. 2R-10]MDJ0277873.1 AAA family ATPase [Sphingomonas sp. 2R-10]
MYDDHYGLTGRPFQLTPDPAFWFDTATHRKAMAYLGYGLSQGEGFIVITGDPGTGKTTLLGHLMQTIDAERLNVIRIVTTQIEADDLLRLVAAGLDVDHHGLTKAQLLGEIERGLHNVARAGRRTLLVIDEAQSLPVGSIEELRMLSNFQAGGYALLQIFLLGQPEFRQRLYGSDRLEQLRQRVIAMHHLDPMGLEEVGPYLEHRLGVVGWTGSPSFGHESLAALHHWSGGIPRRLNQLASRVLLYGAIEGIDRFGALDVEQVIADLDGDGLGTTAPEAAPVMRAVAPVAEATPVVDADPLPMTPPPPPMPPRPIHLSVVEPDNWSVPAGTEPVVAPVGDGDTAALTARIAALEERLEEQDAALRRVLTLLVDWVEGDQRRPDLTSMRHAG